MQRRGSSRIAFLASPIPSLNMRTALLSSPLLSVVLKRSEGGGRESVQEQERESGIDVQQQRNRGGGDVPMYAFVRVQGRGERGLDGLGRHSSNLEKGENTGLV